MAYHRYSEKRKETEMTTLNETGRVEMRPRRWTNTYPEQKLKFPVVGLKAELRDTSIRFTFERAETINEADAIDAQCRAGWNDHGYDFWGFTVEKTETGFVANWACAKNCD
jgi:hypothetical protein